MREKGKAQKGVTFADRYLGSLKHLNEIFGGEHTWGRCMCRAVGITCDEKDVLPALMVFMV